MNAQSGWTGFLAAVCSLLAAPGLWSEDWQISIAEEVVGNETVTRSDKDFKAAGELAVQGLKITTGYEMSFDSKGKLAGYKAMVGVGSNSAAIAASVSGDTVKVRVEQGGKVAGEKSFPFTSSTIVIDNNMASQFRIFSSLLSPSAPGGRISLQLLVPQALLVLPVEAVLEKGTYLWKAGGREGRAVRWEITSPAPLLFQVYQDPVSGAILGADLPQSRASYRLSGYSFSVESAETSKPSYLDSSYVEEKELSVKTGELSMGATFTYPKGARGPLPGVLLVAGSGPNDRDETVGGMKPLRDIAYGLALKGYAVLRFDKRTFTYGRNGAEKLSPASMTVKEEFIDDAVSAYRLLASQKIVDPARMTIIGHSLGAWGLPFIFKDLGTDAASVRHLVFLAPAGRDFGAMLLRQLRFRLSLTPDSEQAKFIVDDLALKLEEYRTKGTLSGPILGTSPAYWEDLFRRDPVALAVGISTDMIFVRGSKDIQVAGEDFESWRKALSGNPRASFATLPDLNHLFEKVEGESTGAEYFREGYVSAAAIDMIADRIGH